MYASRTQTGLGHFSLQAFGLTPYSLVANQGQDRDVINMKCVGIDIGSFSIKVVEIDAVSKGYEISRMQEFPLSPDPNRDRKIEIIDLLRNLFSNYEPTSTTFILGLRQNHVSSRVKMFPFRERHKILKSLAFELEDDLPFSPEDSIFEAKITKYFGNSAEVFAMASPKERIIDLLSLSSDSGIDPDILSTEGIALNNMMEPFLYPPREEVAVETPIPEPKSAQVLLNLGHEHSVFVVLEEGTVKLVRHIDWGGRHLAEALSKALSMHYLEALKELQRKGVLHIGEESPPKEQAIISDTLKTAFAPLIQDLKLSLLETRSDYHLDFKEVFICGGVANIKNITGYLTQHLEIPVNRILPVALFPNLNFDANLQGELSCAIALGLAVEGLRRPKNPPTQFLKNEFTKQSESLQMLWDRWGHTAKVLTGAFVVLLIYAFIKDDLATTAAEEAQALLKNQASSIAGLKGPKASVKAIKDYLKTKEQEVKARALAEKVTELNQAFDVLNRLSSSVPSRRNLSLEVRRFILIGEVLDIQGDVATNQDLETLKNTMANISSDGKVEVLGIHPTSSRMEFSLRIRVARARSG